MTKTISLLLILVLSIGKLYAQIEPELTVVLLESDRIAEVNIDQDSFIGYFGKVTEIAKETYRSIDNNQKIAIMFILHSGEVPTVKFYGKPKITEELNKAFLGKIGALKPEHTKLIDFPLLILFNIKFEEIKDNFSDLMTPNDELLTEYKNAGLNKKYTLNKEFAVQVLSVLAAFEVKVDDQFAGVKNFGKLVAETDFTKPLDIEKLTSQNYDYWRAIMEMSLRNELIPVTKIFILVSQGQFDHALRYIEMINFFCDRKTVAYDYLTELKYRLELFNDELNSTIQQGVAEHDKGKYENAIKIYENVLQDYPYSAWAKYELYFSQNSLDIENKKIDLNYREDWDKAKTGVYKCNPLYNLDVRASNGKENYLLFRRQSIAELFKDEEKILEDVFEYADIAMDLNVYDFAGQLFWYSVNYDKKSRNQLYRLLYCLEKLNVTSLKENFKGDFDKEFKKIEQEKEKQMLDSDVYKMMKEKTK